ncbi:DUF6531 domain-containing protein [Massilia genomosp. 1]|uniref:Type IV secretion protein Rhs n=1 Tax=Massilia genomosp. 1 TaxID=2609280 RepID=A0ABX0N3L8_9BURK|nr:DUF6531 domain-containing protein [Massilia genomosp. 1]NHZ66978.1 hypothetical protein [Massilia genomosp. 1]
MLAGLLGGVGGLIKGAGGLSRAILPCLGKFVAGSVIGEAVGRYVITPIVTRVMGGILGRPVDVATGRKVLLTQDEIDFVMQSQIPLIVSRFYGSNLRHESTLGTGWVLPWDLRLQQRDGKIWFADGEGRETGFPLVQPGHAVFSDVEQCYLACTTAGQFILYDLNEMYYDFGHLDLGSNDIAWVQRVENRTGQWHAYHRDEFGRVQTIRTSGDQQLRLHYTEAPSRLIQVECAFGGTPGPLASYGYDSLGQLISVTDANGNIVRQFTYTDGVMESHTGALGFKCSYHWATVDGQPRVVSCSTSAGEQTSFSYDTATRQTWAKDEQGREAHWTYDEHFQIIACTDFDNGKYHLAYTTAGMPSLIQLPGDREIAFEYDDAARVIREIDPLGRITQTSYDGNSLRISLLTLPDGRQWRAEYDYFGRTKSTIDPLNRRESYEYGNDLSPLPFAKIDARGGRKLMKWNPRGLLIAYTDCSGKSTLYEYDIDGQLAATTNALGQTTRYKRLRTGEPVQVILPDGSAEIFKYDPAGLIVEQHNSAAQSRSWTRNERGQVVHAIDPAQRHLHYRYDVRGRLVELVCGSDTRYSFEYDIGDRVAREINPDGIERRLRYDVAGELLEMEKTGSFPGKAPYAERARRTTSFARDQLGRLLAQATATATTRYMWDDADQLLEARTIPTEIGTELGIKASKVRFEYDKGGRLVTELGSEGAVSYAFDELNNLTTLGLPNNQRIDTLTYGSGHVHQIHSGGHVISDFERDGLHREIQHTQGTLTQRVGYDQLGRRTWQSAGATPELLGPGQGRLWRSYHYQATGELAEQRDNLRGEINFKYNLSGQLHQHNRAAEQVQEQFRWDAVGNLLDDSGRKSSGQLEGNRLKVWQDIRFEYDAWGNVCTKRKGAHQTQHFTFDADDRLLKVRTENLRGITETCFDYDPFGRRIGSTETRLETLGAERIQRSQLQNDFSELADIRRARFFIAFW